MTSFPWEPKPLAPMPWQQTPEPRPLEDAFKALQRDVGYMVTHTAVLVRVTGPHAAELGMLANTRRGQIIPKDTARYSGGHTIAFQDLGMPQPKAPEMTIEELVRAVFERTQQLGLELEP